jgi:hypothetical protein
MSSENGEGRRQSAQKRGGRRRARRLDESYRPIDSTLNTAINNRLGDILLHAAK